MKILSLKIKTPGGNIIRDIPFNENGVSFIYGDIQEPSNLSATINSLGKTLLLKCIDYIFGANEDSSITKEEIKDYVLEAKILFKDKEYSIRRILGTSEFMYINNVAYTLTDYKNHFDIKRSLYSKQIILTKKSTEISYRSSPNREDVVSYLNLLHLDDILDSIDGIYMSQDKIKEHKKSKSELVAFYGNFEVKQIDEEIYFVDKEVKRLTKELERISDKIKKIEISNLQHNIVEEYANKSKSLKKLKLEYEKNKMECERLIEFIENSNKVDVSSEHILAIYKKAKQEVPDMIKKSIREVELFHIKVYEERKQFLNERKEVIEKEMDKLYKKIEELSADIDYLGSIIAMNEVYQESIELYEKYNKDLQEIKYKEGKLAQVKNIDTKIKKEDENLTNKFISAGQIRESYEELIEKYRDFIYSITKLIYDEDVNSYFDIKIRKKHLTARPVIFEFTLKGDTGEGVNEVKKNLMDFLVFCYNTYSDVMMQDSACYNGIDPRQVSGMITEISKIAKETNKQVIIALNKYQVGNYEDVIEFIKENSAITLSERDKLLKFDF